MSNIKDLIVNGVTRVLGKLIANEITTSSIKAISNQSGTKYFATNGTIQTLAFIPGGGEYSAISYPGNTATSYAVAEGWDTTASEIASHAEGYNTTASGNYSHAEGADTQASGQGSHASGIGTIASKSAMTAIGRYNSTCSNGDLFVVGNGTGDNARKTVFKVSDSTGAVNGGGNAIVTVTGLVNANEGFFQTSDKRQKNIISDLSLEKVYDLIDKCQTIIYTLKDDPENKEQIGMIAQEIQEFFPELISEDKEGSLSLDYSRLTVIILRVLKDVINRVKKLEDK